VKGWLPFTSQRGLNQVLFEPCKMVAHHTALQPKLPISCVRGGSRFKQEKKRLILCKQASSPRCALASLRRSSSDAGCSNRFFRMMKTGPAVRFRHSAAARAGRNAFRKQQAAFSLKCVRSPSQTWVGSLKRKKRVFSQSLRPWLTESPRV
jgi:hypothetical protein